MKAHYIALGLLLTTITCEAIIIPTKLVSIQKECKNLVNNWTYLRSHTNNSIEELKSELNNIRHKNSKQINVILNDLDCIADEIAKDLNAIKLKTFQSDPSTIMKNFLFDKEFRNTIWELRKIYNSLDSGELSRLIDNLKQTIERIRKLYN